MNGNGCSVRTALVARPGRTTRRLTRALVGRPKEVSRGPPSTQSPSHPACYLPPAWPGSVSGS